MASNVSAYVVPLAVCTYCAFRCVSVLACRFVRCAVWSYHRCCAHFGTLALLPVAAASPSSLRPSVRRCPVLVRVCLVSSRARPSCARGAGQTHAVFTTHGFQQFSVESRVEVPDLPPSYLKRCYGRRVCCLLWRLPACGQHASGRSGETTPAPNHTLTSRPAARLVTNRRA